MDAYRFSPVPLIMTGLVTRSVGAGGDGLLTEVGLADPGYEKMERKRINTMPRLTNTQFRSANLARLELILYGYLAFRMWLLRFNTRDTGAFAFIPDIVTAALWFIFIPNFWSTRSPPLPPYLRRHNPTVFSRHYSDLVAILGAKHFFKRPHRLCLRQLAIIVACIHI